MPKYRDRAKERREDQNPDYEPNELGSFHAVAPPGNVDLLLVLFSYIICKYMHVLFEQMHGVRELYGLLIW